MYYPIAVNCTSIIKNCSKFNRDYPGPTPTDLYLQALLKLAVV